MRKKWKQWQTLFSWAPIAADGDYSHEIKRCFLLERKAMTNLDNILKSRHITCLTKVHLIKAMVFPVVLYGCESWMKKKAEPWRIDAFELWSWRRLLRSLDSKKIKCVNPKEINPEYSLERLMLRPPNAKSRLTGKTLMLRKVEGRRRRRVPEADMVR